MTLLQIRTVKLILVISTIIMAAVMMLQGFSKADSARLSPDAETAFNTTNLIRLHIMANSDSLDDQTLKMMIRNAVIKETGSLLAGADTKREVWQILSDSLERIRDIAADQVRDAGKSYDVIVELGTFSFPSCNYGSLHVPAGDYDAIRVVLGQGTGKNWWCVLFPPLCFIDIADDGRIRGLDANASPGEALLRLDLDSKVLINGISVHDSVMWIPFVESLASAPCLFLSLKGLL